MYAQGQHRDITAVIKKNIIGFVRWLKSSNMTETQEEPVTRFRDDTGDHYTDNCTLTLVLLTHCMQQHEHKCGHYHLLH